ncbi:MAG: biopolymer transporter ExbD [Gammaproteobacteria bacterium]|nr:biopolymer transporter ExbD [Gammaproteobacteria bacterium]NNJ84820.1 biopolymer transporter ExbD [Gammaproteobacteria bacterium]
MRIAPVLQRHRKLGLTPLVDVVFLLLIFFMLVSRFDVLEAISIGPPPGTTDNGRADDAVLLRIETDGRLALNGISIDIKQLPAKLVPFLAHDPARSILVHAADDVPLRRLVRVLDGLHGMGADNLILVE